MNSQNSNTATVTHSLAVAGLVFVMLFVSCGKGPPIAATSNRDWVVIAYFDGGMATTPGVLAVEVVGPRLNPKTRKLIREVAPDVYYTMSLDDSDGLIIEATDFYINEPTFYLANLRSWSGKTVETNNIYPIDHDELVDTVGLLAGYSTLYTLSDARVQHDFERMHELRAKRWVDTSFHTITAYLIEADSIRFVNNNDHGVIVGVIWPGISEEALFEVDLIDLTISPYVADTVVTDNQ